MNKKIYLSLTILLISLAVFLLLQMSRPKNLSGEEETGSGVVQKKTENIKEAYENKTQQKVDIIDNSKSVVIIDVPFISQAPGGNWDETVFQDGCEEASVIMAMKWVYGQKITKEGAEEEIRKISEFEDGLFPKAIDISADDTVKLVKEYYNFSNIEIKKNINANEIKNELKKGNVVLVPAYGRALKNPYYTAGGPTTHMLVVIGWDENRKEFITNDPGTKRGEKYRYGEKVLFDAIWQYPTGQKHADVPDFKDFEKVMIIFAKGNN